MTDIQKLAAEYLDVARQVGGCGDGNCVILHAWVMHTNGGCRCTRHMDATRERGITRLLMKAQQLALAAIAPEQEKKDV